MVKDKPSYTLTLQAEPGNWAAPPLLRLRAALKRFKRDYGMRCTRCVETKEGTEP